MRTILYPDGNIPKSYYYNDNTNDNVMILITLILIVSFFAFVFYKIYRGKKEIIFNPCPLGECATSLQNGNKRCPKNLEEFIYFDSSTEVCNPASACTNLDTPYALLPNGTTNIDGICHDGETCNCVKNKGCPVFSQVIFTITESGSYQQTSGGNVLTGGNTLFPENNQTCTIDGNSLNKLGCLKTPLECLQDNPCVQGVATLIPPIGMSPQVFAVRDDKFNFPVTCMPAIDCPAGASIYNYFTSRAECTILPVK